MNIEHFVDYYIPQLQLQADGSGMTTGMKRDQGAEFVNDRFACAYEFKAVDVDRGHWVIRVFQADVSKYIPLCCGGAG